ncbi:hypothetical protein PQR01_00305 [Paraburkholderia rhynchosiae]|uniref:Uncharacterized protein n=1 Tax=Paraburkholderia rhynchosiae TaxID=487049 RepID=A0ACC7N2V5_9BURK
MADYSQQFLDQLIRKARMSRRVNARFIMRQQLRARRGKQIPRRMKVFS